MEALRSSLRMETASSPPHQQQNQEAAILVAEKGGLVGDSFSVDELLNLGEFEESEKGREENDEEEEGEALAVAGDEEAEQMETEEDYCNANIVSSSPPSSSALSYEGSQSLSEISLPAHDAEELEWVSLIIDDSLSEFPPDVAPFPSLPQASNRSVNAQRESHQQSHDAAVATAHVPPIPCATVCAVSTEPYVPLKAKRSKRSRSFAVVWSTSLPFTDLSSTTTTSASSCSSSSSSSLSPYLIYDQPSATWEQSYLLYESHPSLPPPPPPPSSTKTRVPKKRGRRPKQPTAAAALHGERRCSHCGSQKTPQRRAGPLGAKTLCNACGVRYKSGRLLPEYRPACSPTFVESIHSSSHLKVLELRRLKEAELFHAVGPAPVPTC